MISRHARCAVVRVTNASLRACLRVADRPARYDERVLERHDLRGIERWLSSERCLHVALALDDVEWSEVWVELRSSLEVHLVRLPDLALCRTPRADAVEVSAASAAATEESEIVWTVDLFAHGLLEEWSIPAPLAEGLRELDRSQSLLTGERQRHASRLEELARLSTAERTTSLLLTRLHDEHAALAERSSATLRRLAAKLVEAARPVSEAAPSAPS